MSQYKEPEWGIVANVLNDSSLRTGAKVWLIHVNGDNENPKVRGCSKSGRVIEKHIAYKRLGNFRAAWLTPVMQKRAYGQLQSATKEEAEAKALALCVRFPNILEPKEFMTPTAPPAPDTSSERQP